MGLSAADRAALEIGRLFLRAHTAEQLAATLEQTNRELQARLQEFENGAEAPVKAVTTP